MQQKAPAYNSDDQGVQEQACGALRTLADGDENNSVAIAKGGAIPVFVKILGQGLFWTIVPVNSPAPLFILVQATSPGFDDRAVRHVEVVGGGPDHPPPPTFCRGCPDPLPPGFRW